jgi:hypothetical protein
MVRVSNVCLDGTCDCADYGIECDPHKMEYGGNDADEINYRSVDHTDPLYIEDDDDFDGDEEEDDR